MYTSTTISTPGSTFNAWRHVDDPGSIWIRDGDRRICLPLSLAEATQIMTGLQRELAAVEAQTRSAAA